MPLTVLSMVVSISELGMFFTLHMHYAMHSSGIGIRISIKMYLLLYDVVGGVVGMDRFHPGVKLRRVGTIL